MKAMNPYEQDKIKLINDINYLLGINTFRYRTTWDKANKQDFFPSYNQEIIALKTIYDAVKSGHTKGTFKASKFYVHFHL